MNADTGSHTRVFLATTALEQFWNTAARIVFAGEWCLLPRNKASWGSLKPEVMGSPYEGSDWDRRSYDLITETYESILPALGNKLNVLHNVNHDHRYWRIMLGPWLQLYVSVMYDHFLYLKTAMIRYPGFTTIGLSQESFVTPVDTMHHVELAKSDPYNLQIYTNIMHFLGMRMPLKPLALGLSYTPHRPNRSFISRFLMRIAEGITNLCTTPRITLHLQASYFTKKSLRKLVALHFGRIWPRSSALDRCRAFSLDADKRKQLAGIEFEGGDFARCLLAMLPADIPQCFVEGFDALRQDARGKYWSRPKAILSSNSWYFDEHFKHWAGTSAEKGSLLLGTQHGGCYGLLAHKLAEDHELAISDCFYSWGWTRERVNAKVTPMPATNMTGSLLGADNKRNGILWGATVEPRYVLELPRLPSAFPEYMSRQMRFLKSLPSQLLEEIRFRPHYEDHGWGIVDRLKQYFPAMRVETWAVSFEDSLADCRLYVCDHLSTTYAQAFAVNKPIILFLYDRQTTRLSSQAETCFIALREAGILFDTPEEAAHAVSAIYDDVEKWWNEPARQNAIQLFRDQFLKTSPHLIAMWSEEFAGILAS
ncbi:MAG: LIC12162 family protein [Pseudomonadota bacterium]